MAYPHEILIVDDEKKVGKSLGRLLIMEDLAFEFLDNAVTALALIESRDKPFSLIISDQRMPDLQGTEFLEKTKAVCPDTIRFLLTGYSDMDTIMNSVNKGSVHKYINKPWDTDQLLADIRFALEEFEIIMENEKLLKIAVKKNKKLYNLDIGLMELTRAQNSEISRLDKEITGLEKQLEALSPASGHMPGQIIARMENFLEDQGAAAPEMIHRFFTAGIQLIYREFDELAKRNGFEMPREDIG